MEISFIKTGNFNNLVVHKLYVDNVFDCFALMPSSIIESIEGSHRVQFRPESPTNKQYENHPDRRVRDIHQGMIGFKVKQAYPHLFCIFPGFSEITQHIYLAKNVDQQQQRHTFRYQVRYSIEAYEKFYKTVAAKLSSDHKVFLRYFNVS